MSSKEMLHGSFVEEVKCQEGDSRCKKKFQTKEKLENHLKLYHNYRDEAAKDFISDVDLIICNEPKQKCTKRFKVQGPQLLKQHLQYGHKYTEEKIESKMKTYFEIAGNTETETVVPNLDFLFEEVNQNSYCTPQTRDHSPDISEERPKLNIELNITESNQDKFENLGYFESIRYSDTQSVVSLASPQEIAHPLQKRATFNIISEKYEDTDQIGEKEKPLQKPLLFEKKSKRKLKNVAPLQTVQCQVCDIDFTKSYNLRRHYSTKHKMDKESIGERMKNVKMTQLRCIFCQGLFTKLTVHHTRCQN